MQIVQENKNNIFTVTPDITAVQAWNSVDTIFHFLYAAHSGAQLGSRAQIH